MEGKNQAVKLAPGAQYPPGSYMAVYGHFGPRGKPGDTDYRPGDKVASEQNPCGTSGLALMDPSCFDVERTVGIKNKANP